MEHTTGTLGGNTIAAANQPPNMTGYATLTSPSFTGIITIADSSYGNTKLYVTNTTPTAPAYGVSYPSYIQIGQAVGGYAGAIGGGIQGGVGGFTTLWVLEGLQLCVL